MSSPSVKLSSTLKQLIKSPAAQPGPVPLASPNAVTRLFDGLSSSAKSNGLGHNTWLTLSGAALVTLNSPATLCALYSYATKDLDSTDRSERTVKAAHIAAAINSLGALRNHLEPEVAEKLSTEPLREQSPSTVASVSSAAHSLWKSIYQPHDEKLLAKLADSHPDLPVHILSSHYGPLLADPRVGFPPGHAKIGRVLTSVVAIACLRAQGGVGPQVTSHVFGLRKSLDAGSGAESEDKVEGHEWLASEQGCQWVLEQVDKIVEVVTPQGPSFATRAKL